MGLKPVEIKALYLRDFNLMLTGYYKRREHELNQMRHIMWSVINYGGMGVTNPVRPEDIWPLSIDIADEKKMITTVSMAVELLKEFLSF